HEFVGCSDERLARELARISHSGKRFRLDWSSSSATGTTWADVLGKFPRLSLRGLAEATGATLLLTERCLVCVRRQRGAIADEPGRTRPARDRRKPWRT